MPVKYPLETEDYRTARDELLAAELDLRTKVEEVAALRRQLPLGGKVARDYAFTSPDGAPVPLSALFTKGRNTLALYSLMYRPEAASPCPMCVSMLDGLAGQVAHIGQLMDVAVVAAATPDQLRTLANQRHWSGLNLLSAQNTSYQTDYNAETPDGAQHPIMNIFLKRDDGIFHFWGSEGYFADVPGQPRHIDQLWPLWNLLDLTPGGRGTDWFPSVNY